ncbi:hypothetical protein AXG93_399s1060 [Marchantia polymorpha subsp. ruderalis]|uniref:Vacuolar protein 8 n=1 Tax=Marchantia polymorpha subsp. ruderalis TaxID=1480154 RepID=A0A176WI45_MARPO|nr:hypothetical protein AXG93_399s1060 [Marchantia polymorpha subsp. ruderalis]
MSRGVCLLSWGIFTLEAILKYGRSWAHSLYFRDVPCAIVALHDNKDDHDTASASLVVFGYFVLMATLLEVSLYAPYVYATLGFWRANRHCDDEGAGCPDGTTRLIDMLMITMAIACLHWASSLGTVLAFGAAMGMGISARAQRSSLPRCLSRFVRKRDERDRLILAKQKELDKDDDFALLVRVVRDGRTESCRGLAATAIAVLATQPDVLPLNSLIEAVVPLKRLARSEAVEHVEVALGALLNASLNERSHEFVIAPILESNEFGSSFMSCLIRHAHIGHTTRCQELAVGLLSRLVGSRKGKRARTALMSYKGEQGGVRGVQLCTDLIKHGATSPIKAGGAAVLAEIAYWEDWQVKGTDPHIEECIQALVKALEAGQTIAFSAAKALCSLAYKNQAVKVTIVRAGGISNLVDLLKGPLPNFGLQDINGQIPREEDSRSIVTSVKPHLEDDVRSDAARALRILALNNPQHQKLIAEAKAIPLLIDLMASKSPKVQVQAMAALSGLSFRSTTIKDMIGEWDDGKFFSRLMDVLKSSEGHDPMAEAILEKVAHVTHSLIEGNESNRQKAVKQGMREKLQDCIDNKKSNYKDNGKGVHSAERALKILQEKLT